jgi:predicted DNA binding CopG/RHH family protein
MKTITLDTEEQDLLDAFEAGEFHSVLTPERKQFVEASAQQTCQLNQLVNINISQSDLIALQKTALQQGIPYQLLMSSILHKYASGMLHEVSYNP